MTKAIDETTLSLRLHKAGMRLDRNGEGFRVLCRNQVVMSRSMDGGPLSLSDVDQLTARLAQ
jgi:hypothetical protein